MPMLGYTFVCYTHEDTRFALKLARALKKRGIEIWLDQWHTPQSGKWDRPMLNALRGCSHFLLILSPEAGDSWVVRDQTGAALDQGKRLIPVLHRPCRLPPAIQDLEIFDFSQGRFQQQVDRLLADIYHRPRAVTAAPTPAVGGLRSSWLRHSRLGLALGGLFVLALGLWLLSGRSNSQPETFTVPTEIEAAPLAEPVSIPTIDTAQITNPEPTPMKVARRSQDGKVMLSVPAGDFLMGSPEADTDAGDDEKPQHLVYLDAFWIDETEITNSEYQRCVEAGVCSAPWAVPGLFTGDDLPVVGVNWAQAAAYCDWVGARLPTEAEWEKAARGADGRIYPWGDAFDQTRLNYCDENCVADWRDFEGNDGYRYTAPIGSYPTGASPYGVLDMSGNVWEWTADWYDPDYYAGSVYKNPPGPELGVQRVIRGGSWYYPSQSVRIARRHKDVPTSRYDNIGFRCATSVPNVAGLVGDEQRTLPGGRGIK